MNAWDGASPMSRAPLWTGWIRMAPLILALTILVHSADADGAEIGRDANACDVEMAKLWELSCDDEDIVFGRISGGKVGTDGNAYLLDSQLKRILVIDRVGNVVRTIGREGPGPGELANPTDVIVYGKLGLIVVEHWPSRLVGMTYAGEPLVTIDPSHDLDDYAIYVVHKADYSSGRLVCMMSHKTYSGGKESITCRLARLSDRGEIEREYLRWSHEYRFRRDVVDETSGYFPAQAWCLLSDGTLAVAPTRDKYLIELYGVDGDLLRTIGSDFRSPKRTAAELNKIRTMKKKIVNGREVPLQFNLEETDPAILSMQVLDDGSLWVATAMHIRDLAPGEAGRYDVFSRNGVFVGQHVLHFTNDPSRDRFWLLNDGSVLQVKNFHELDMTAIGARGALREQERRSGWSVALWGQKPTS